MIPVDAAKLLLAYEHGIFPMADGRNSETVYWLDPLVRGILPLDGFHVPRRLGRTVRQGRFQVSVDEDFEAVVEACAEPTASRPDSWINDDIRRLYGELFHLGAAHTVECRRDGVLVGGIYGVSVGAAFFGESMFSRVRDASKVALVHLAARMTAGGYRLLDTQFVTDHLRVFGATEVPRETFRKMLGAAIRVPATLPHELAPEALAAFLRKSALRRPPAEP